MCAMNKSFITIDRFLFVPAKIHYYNVRILLQNRFFMKVLSKLYLLSFFIFSPYLYASLFSISEQEINHYLATRLSEKIALQDSVGVPALFQLDYHLQHLNTQIGRTAEKKVVVSGVLDGVLTTNGKKRKAQLELHLDTLPYLNPENGGIYLKQVRLLNWSIQPEKYQQKLQLFLPLVTDSIHHLLNNQPIYILDTTQTKELLIKRFGKAIVVEEGVLQLETTLFQN